MFITVKFSQNSQRRVEDEVIYFLICFNICLDFKSMTERSIQLNIVTVYILLMQLGKKICVYESVAYANSRKSCGNEHIGILKLNKVADANKNC